MLAQALDGEAAGAGVHGLVQQRLHLGLFLTRGGPGLGGFEAHHPGHQRRDGHVGEAVDALGNPFEAGQPLRERHPIPDHPLLHGVEGNGLGARHGEHRPVAPFRHHRRKAEAAVAEDHGGDPVPAGDGAVGIPLNLCVVVGVQIDEPRRDDQPIGIDNPFGSAFDATADMGNPPILDPKIAAIARHPSAIDNRPALDAHIELSHAHSPFVDGFRLRFTEAVVKHGSGDRVKAPRTPLGGKAFWFS